MRRSRRHLALTSLIITIAAGGCAENSRAAEDKESSPCQPISEIVPLDGLPEASGAALSRTTPRLFWAHNDSGEPTLFAVQDDGKVVGRVRATGAEVDDWEDVSVGPCANRSCVFIADIGDNNSARKQVMLYRFPEPGAGDGSLSGVESLTATYPDGPHDAEAAFLSPDGDLFIITKEKAAVVYRWPGATTTRGGTSARLERITTLPLPLVTDAESTPDGRWLAVRTNHLLVFYRTRDLLANQPGEGIRVDLRQFKEPQGEGVAIDNDGVVYLVGEGNRNGTLLKLRCTLPS